MKKSYLLIAACVGVLVCLGYLVSKDIVAKSSIIDLKPKTEPFTELYFDSPDTLPTRTIKGVSESFSFTIHNKEGITTVYPYVVYFTGPTVKKIVIAKGTETLAPDEYKSIAILHTFGKSDQQGTVVVELPNQQQKLTFIVSAKK